MTLSRSTIKVCRETKGTQPDNAVEICTGAIGEQGNMHRFCRGTGEVGTGAKRGVEEYTQVL